MTTIDYYDILGVIRTASADEIHAAYRKAVKTAHPDAGGTSGLFRLLKEADDTLTDPDRRRDYDLTIDGTAPPPKPATPRPGPKHTTYPTYVPPRDFATGRPHEQPAASTDPLRAADPVPRQRGLAVLRPTRIDILTAGLAVMLLAGQLMLGQVPMAGFVLGPNPGPGAAIALSLALYVIPAVVLSRKLITPVLRDAHARGRAAFVTTAIALGLLTVVLLWTPVTWLAVLGLFLALWLLRITWRLLVFFNP